MKRYSLWLGLGLVAGTLVLAQTAPRSRSAQVDVYLSQGRLAEAADLLGGYVDAQPGDLTAGLELVSLLWQLDRPDAALARLEALHRAHPRQEAVYFQLGVAYASRQAFAQAATVFQELQRSRNPGMAQAANEAARRLESDRARARQFAAESRVFALANGGDHEAVLLAVAEIEQQGELSYAMAMQRLYALYNLRRYEAALALADTLASRNARATDLAFLRAELLVALKRPDEAMALWRQLEEATPGSSEAAEAKRRRLALTPPPPPAVAAPVISTAPAPPPPVPPPTPPAPVAVESVEERVYGLARAEQHREVVAAVDALEREKGRLELPMALQRLYSWQALGASSRVRTEAERLSVAFPESAELLILRADQALQDKRYWEASRLLSQIVREHGGRPAEEQARRRLAYLPPVVRPDKWQWGEAWLSGDFLGRFGAVAGSGLVRQGVYVPGARWLQPYAEFRFGVDTESHLERERSVVVDNFTGFFGGARTQVWPSEYLFVYAQGGTGQDLLDEREDGDWAYDYQAGAYGFKSWGPGVRFLSDAELAGRGLGGSRGLYDWRGDWFVDGGADFSYYHRYASWIGYAQAHEGWRLLQIGPSLALDAYLVENFSWDVKGNYFDNLAEIGPGARWVWHPCAHADVICRVEYLNGFYTGRDDLDNRGDTSEHYDEVRVGLVVGLRW